MKRRHFIATLFASALAVSLRAATPAKRTPRILLRSSWQTVNIGDIAHTPGVLRLLEEQFPEAEVRLWPVSVGEGVEAMLRKRFPRLTIIKTEAEVKTAFAECDFLLHGSGPGLVAEAQLERWDRETGKPFGVFGITLSAPLASGAFVYGVPTERTIKVLNRARFVFFRDTPSLAYARSLGCTCPMMEFGPDGAFACDVRDDAAANAFLRANNLVEGRFLCCFSKLRYTPHWLMHQGRPRDESKHQRNEALKEHDHVPVRAAITAVVRETDFKILLCPEDTSEMAIEKELVFDRLPSDVQARVVWREKYWLTDEALSTYLRSAGIFGHEMHSPIMAIGHGIPAIVGRWAEQTSKGYMWRDIGLDDWLFDFDRDDELVKFVPTVLALAKDPAAARAKAALARERVRQRQREMVAALRAKIG